MSLTDRIASIISSIEFQLAQSLPMINDKGEEILFFYKVKELNEDQYFVTEIKYIIFRSTKTGDIVKANASEVLPGYVMNEAVSSHNWHTMPAEDELNLEDKYLAEYEQAYESYIACQEIEKDIIRELSSVFNELLKGTSLLCVYKYLAPDFIELLECK